MKPYIKIAPLKQPNPLKESIASSINCSPNLTQATVKSLIDCLAQITKRMESLNQNQDKISLIKKVQDLIMQQKTISQLQKQQNQNLMRLTKKIQDNIQNNKNNEEKSLIHNKDNEIFKNKKTFDSKQNLNVRMQDVFQNIQIQIPQNKQDLDDWMGKVCKKTFSISFNLFKNGQINQNQLKTFCSQNILRNFIYFARRHNVNQTDIHKINSTMIQLLKYFKRKYPEAEETQTSSKFSGKLIERDFLNQNQYDLVFKSKVKFNYIQNGNYNSQIMQFLNFVIKLPYTQQYLSQIFKIEMNSIFEALYKKQGLQELLGKRNPQVQEIQKIQREKRKTLEQIQYEQKVKSYTSFSIGQKISANLPLFSPTQIESGILKLKSSAMMRVVTKWCEELSQWFDPQTILSKQTPFRLKNGNQKYFDKWALKFLNYLLQRQYKSVAQKIQNITKNNYLLQSKLLKETPNSNLIKFSEDEVIVGQFASVIFKNNQNYLINYLNSLIHAINVAMIDFHKYIVSTTVKNYYVPFELKKYLENSPDKVENKKFQQLVEKINKFFETISQNYDPSHCPELVTFKIGDLLRCKCSSRYSEIIGLYSFFQQISKKNQKQFKIVRVKNRLNRGNKDILMNLLYKETILIEIQLAIKQQKSKFIECSNKFNHYLYQLERAQFGPITQMCTIWMSKDYRAQFYLQNLQKFNKRVKQKYKKQQVKSNGSGQMIQFNKSIEEFQCCNKKKHVKMTLPFRCNFCTFFYYDCSFEQKHLFCEQCKKFTCFLCQFDHASQQQKLKIIPYPQSIQVKQISICQQIPSTGGVMVNLKSKNKKALTFYTSKQKDEYYLFSYNGKDSVKLIEKVGAKKERISSYLKQNLIYTSQQIQNTLIKPNIQIVNELINYFLVVKLLKDSHKSQKKTLQIVHRNINQDLFMIKYIQTWPEVKRLNFSFNPNIKKFQKILDSLQMQTIPQNMWRGLKQLELQHNRLKDIAPLMQCKQLIKLNISHNQIQNIPDNINELKNLKYLQAWRNNLNGIPESIGQLELIQLKLKDNFIKQIPQSLCKVKTLQELDLKFTKLTKLPNSIGSLKELKIFRFCLYESESIPQTFSQMKNLNYLQLDSCLNLANLPQKINQLQQLQYIHLTNCFKICNLPQKFGQLNKLKELSFYQCGIKEIPDNLSMLQSLQSLSINTCKELIKLPDSIGKVQHIKSLTIAQCHNLTSFGTSFSKILSIQLLRIKGLYKLKSLQTSFKNVQSIHSLHMFNCNLLKTMQNAFSSLQSVNILQISSCMRLENYPISFSNIQVMNKLYIQSSQQITNYKTSLNNLRQVNYLKLQCISQFQSFDNLQQVTEIQLKKCSPKDQKDYFPKVKQLKLLKIQELQTKTMTNLFTNLQQAHSIQIYFCKKLQNLSDVFQNYKNQIIYKFLMYLTQFQCQNPYTQQMIYNISQQLQSLWKIKQLRKLRISLNQLLLEQEIPFKEINPNLQVHITYLLRDKQKVDKFKQQFERHHLKCYPKQFMF